MRHVATERRKGTAARDHQHRAASRHEKIFREVLADVGFGVVPIVLTRYYQVCGAPTARDGEIRTLVGGNPVALNLRAA
jgi:hypothetical protein